jgi:hypothetical protein
MRLGAVTITGSSSTSPPSIALSVALPLIFFEIACDQVDIILPSLSLSLPCDTGQVHYSLKGILYFGAQHFTACLFTANYTWAYNGQANGGCPYTPASGPLVEDNIHELTTLKGKPTLMYLYVLDHDTASAGIKARFVLYTLSSYSMNNEFMPVC